MAVHGDPVLGQRQVFGLQPEIHRMGCNLVHAPAGSQSRQARLVALHHCPIGFAGELHMAHRKIKVGITEIPIVDCRRFLKHRGVGLMGDRHHSLAVVEHVVAPHLIGAVGQATRMVIVGRHQQQLGGVSRTTADHNQISAELQQLAIALHQHRGDAPATGIGFELLHHRAGQQAHA